MLTPPAPPPRPPAPDQRGEGLFTSALEVRAPPAVMSRAQLPA